MENCKKDVTSTEDCTLENFRKFVKFVFGSKHMINETEYCLDPYFVEHIVIDAILAAEAEAFQLYLNGLSNHNIEGAFFLKNEYEDSFLIAFKFVIPWIYATGEYNFKCNLGIFNFDSNGEFYNELCEFLFVIRLI